MIMTGIDMLMDLIARSKYIVALIGAGISTNAGIPDFRGPGGLYSRRDIPAEKIFDLDTFRSDPSLFYTHIGSLAAPVAAAKPTKGHLFLKKLEDLGKLKMTISQNIDGLHEAAGVKNVIDIHGNFRHFTCLSCGKVHETTPALLSQVTSFPQTKALPQCDCGGLLKPDIVFFGEPVKDLELALTEVQKADLLITLGTSLSVYPVSTLPSYLSDNAKLVIINASETQYDHKAKIVLSDDIDTVVERLRMA